MWPVLIWIWFKFLNPIFEPILSRVWTKGKEKLTGDEGVASDGGQSSVSQSSVSQCPVSGPSKPSGPSSASGTASCPFASKKES